MILLRRIYLILVFLVFYNVFLRGIGEVGHVGDVRDALGMHYDSSYDFYDDWGLFIQALIWVESRGVHDAVGRDDDCGVLQIRPIYVHEANRIKGYEAYDLEDRFDRERSIEMFNVVNGRHNPDLDFRKAAKLHNPGGGDDYYGRIIDRYEQLRLNKILNNIIYRYEGK